MNNHFHYHSNNKPEKKLSLKPSDIIHLTVNSVNLSYTPEQVLEDRRVAIRDVLVDNTFKLKNHVMPPYHVHIRLQAKQLILEVYGPICDMYKEKYQDSTPYQAFFESDEVNEGGEKSLTNSHGKNIDFYQFIISLTPFKSIMKEYFDICESYSWAVKNMSLQQIEAIDITRRSMHNEASNMLREHLLSKLEIDIQTARSLFTLICSLKKRNTV